MNIQLTKSAKKSVALIYKEYEHRVASGENKSSAMRFSIDTYKTLYNAISEDLNFLKNIGFVKIFLYNDFDITYDLIIYMENLTRSTILEWLSFGSQFVP